MRVALPIWIESQGDRLPIAEFPQFEVFEKLSTLVGSAHSDPSQVAWVISEHYSRGRLLPVVLFERPDFGLWFLVRHNSLDWRLSVSSESRLSSDRFAHLFCCSPPPSGRGDLLRAVYFEGFPKDRVFGYYESDHCRWSAYFTSPEVLWATVFECLMLVNALKPMSHSEVGIWS